MKYLLLFILSIVQGGYTHAQQHQWIRGGGSHYIAPSGYIGQELVREMVTDERGNIYILAEFMGDQSITFDDLTLPIYSSVNSVFRSKMALLSYSCEGKLRWGQIFSSEGGTIFTAMTYDGKGGIYVGSSSVGSSSNRYFGDTVIGRTQKACWIIKYDTLGKRQWMQSLGENNTISFAALGNHFGQLIMRDSILHFIKPVLASGAQIAPGIVGQRGIYDITFDRRGNLLDAKRLPLADTLLYLNVFNPSNIHAPSNTLHISVTSHSAWGGGVATFDSLRNFISYDTFTSPEPLQVGQRAVIFREGNFQYVFGSFFGSKCTFKGIDFEQPFKTGKFAFIMKMDLDNNLIWKQLFFDLLHTGQGLSTCFEGIHNGKIILTGQVRGGIINEEDTMFTQHYNYITPALPIVILDTNGVVQTMDYWRNDGRSPVYHEGFQVTCNNNSMYIGGWVNDTIWGGDFGYRFKGGHTDFFVAKYGYNCQCEPPLSDFAFDTALAGQAIRLQFTQSRALDSMTWEYDKKIFSRTWEPELILPEGTHKICVTAYNACGPTRRCKELQVACPQPEANFDYALTDNSLVLTYTGSQPVDSMIWLWGNGQQSKGSTAKHTYTRSGDYEVCLIAYQDCGSDTLCLTFNIQCAPPMALFQSQQEGLNLNLNYPVTTDPDSLLWSFGDGQSSSRNPVTHTYARAGDYEVCLRVWDPCGTDSFCTILTLRKETGITTPFNEASLLLYPNPVQGQLYLSRAQPGANITLYDSQGRLCYNEVLYQSTHVIDMEHLASGVYALSYRTKEGKVRYVKVVR